jgi:heme exporter protein B
MSRRAASLRKYGQHILHVVRKDLLVEARTKERFPLMAAFAFVVIVVWNVTMPLGRAARDVVPGIFWIAVMFAGVLGINHSFGLERESGGLQSIRLCPVDRSVLYLGKLLGNLLFMGSMELLLLPVVLILFNLPLGGYLLRLVVVLFLGTLGFVGIGTVFAAMTLHSRMQEMLLPLLVFPVLVPVLIVAVKATGAILAQQSLADIAPWLHFLAIFDLIFVGLAIVLFEYILESE